MSMISVNAFLGNPLFFYVHQGFFHPSTGAFNGVADYVNKIAPDTEWGSTGALVQNMNLLRLRDDGDYDALAFSPDFFLKNTEDREIVFHITKTEDFRPEIRSIFVDGVATPYTRMSDGIAFEIHAAPKQTRRVAIAYVNNLNISEISTSKTKVTAAVLRKIGDFRDITLSRSDVGWKLAAFYYGHHFDSIELYLEYRGTLIGAVGSLILFFTVALYRKKKYSLPR
jgi:hypothetical protein